MGYTLKSRTASNSSYRTSTKCRTKMWFVYVFLLFFVASLVGVGIGIFRIHIPQTRWKSGRLNAPSKALLPKEYPADYITAVPEDIISYWWETEKGKSVSFRTSRIMHGAVKSAILYGNEKPVYVFSNTLPLDFFCEGSSLRGHERNMSLGYVKRCDTQRPLPPLFWPSTMHGSQLVENNIIFPTVGSNGRERAARYKMKEKC